MKGSKLISVDYVPLNDADVHVVNAARISFAKQIKRIDDGDKRLLRFLARHSHWTPFAHVRIGAMTRSLPLVQDIMGGVFYDDKIKAAGFVCEKPISSEFYFITGSWYGWMRLTLQALNEFNDDYGVVADNVRLIKELLSLVRGIAPECWEAFYSEFVAMNESWTLGNELSDSLEVPSTNRWSLFPVQDWEMPKDLQSLTVHCKTPVPIARQVFKSNHLTIVYNEVSRRYVALWPTISKDISWRAAASDAKQGSAGALGKLRGWLASKIYNALCRSSLVRYKLLLALGVAPEQARFILPQGMEVEFFMTATVRDLQRVVELRKDSTAQREVQEFARQLELAISEHTARNDFIEAVNQIDNALDNK